MAHVGKVARGMEIALAEQLWVPAVTLNGDFADIFKCVTKSRNLSNDVWDDF